MVEKIQHIRANRFGRNQPGSSQEPIAGNPLQEPARQPLRQPSHISRAIREKENSRNCAESADLFCLDALKNVIPEVRSESREEGDGVNDLVLALFRANQLQEPARQPIRQPSHTSCANRCKDIFRKCAESADFRTFWMSMNTEQKQNFFREALATGSESTSRMPSERAMRSLPCRAGYKVRTALRSWRWRLPLRSDFGFC